MRVYDLPDKQGRAFAFEVTSSIGATILRGPRFLSRFEEDQFCEFEVNGQLFVAEEPFGDNSRYWIGTEPPGWCEEIDLVRETFSRANALDAMVLGAFGLWKRFGRNP